jgi:regulator of PEP synthase PpsR (kinase-PPPase family)
MPPQTEIPVPISNYLSLIEEKKSPYYDIIQHVIKDMEFHLRKADHSEVVYTISPRQLLDQLEEKIKSEKLTTYNICRSILAILYGSDLKIREDYYKTTSSHGRRNYHVKLNSQNLLQLKQLL